MNSTTAAAAAAANNGRISHRSAGGPDLNYLYATNRDEDENVPIFVRKKNGRKQAKKPVQRGRKKDKRTLRGTTLYLGGEEGPNNKIYCIPGHASRVLCIDTKTDEVYPIGPEFDASNMVLSGKFKWLRGIVVGDIIYGLPCHADCLLRIDTRTDEVGVIEIPYEDYFDTSIPENGDETQTEAYLERHSPWKYHGGAISPHDKCIYAVPQYSKKVLRFNPVTEECSFVGPKFEGRCKWYGGVVGNSDGAIYCIPQNAEGILRIDASGVNYKGEVDHDHNGFAPSSPEARVLVTVHGDYPLGLHKWHGAAASADGTIVSVPNNADNVLCCKPAPNAMYPTPNTKFDTMPEPEIFILEGQSPDDVATGRHRDDGKYKYLGAMAGTDGHVYCFPSGSERVLQVNTVKRVARSVGPNLRDAGMEPLFQNKWQNGLTNDTEECVYAIPLGAETVLRIKTNNSPEDDSEPSVTTWKLPLPNKTLEKWEGGVIAENGIMYCMPNNHKAVLQIVPPYIPSREELHKENDRKEEEREKVREMERQQKQKEMEEKKAKKEQKRQERLEKKKNKERNDGKELSSRCNQRSEVEEEKKDDNEMTTMVKEKKPELPSTTPEGIPFKYKTGIATLRSSSHRVKYSLDHREVNNASSTFLPEELCNEYSLPYSMEKYDFRQTIVDMLQSCSPDLIGSFRTLNGNGSGTSTEPKLDNFVVPIKSLTRKCQRGGKVEIAQQYLSDRLASDENFLSLFDRFLEEVVLPNFKQRLVDISAAEQNEAITFYYQRPPTLRIQPGPARAYVKAHDDAEYGHQNGELNFWLPLTSHKKTGVDLWVESKHGAGDYHQVGANVGEVLSFHGSTCRHYVNSNHSLWTRMSLDFRVGVSGYFDPNWQMNGTTADHSRRKVTV